jgi:hypothetical protein
MQDKEAETRSWWRQLVRVLFGELGGQALDFRSQVEASAQFRVEGSGEQRVLAMEGGQG